MGVKIQIVYSRPKTMNGAANQLLMQTLQAIHGAEIKYKLNIETSESVRWDLLVDDIPVFSADETGELPSTELMMESIMEYSKNHN